MTLFLVCAALLVAIGLAWVLPPLLRAARADANVDRAAANLGILKDQLVELEAEHRRGAIGAEQYAETKAELERRVLEDVVVEPTAAPGASKPLGVRISAAVLVVCIPLAAGLLYARLGDTKAFDPLLQTIGKDGSLDPQQIENMVADLAARLQKEPNNAEGWGVLARSYVQMQRVPEALEAFEKAAALSPNDADLLADYADALALSEGRKINTKALVLIRRALEANPKQWKALAMAGSAAFESKDYKAAAGYWQRLRELLPPTAEFARDVDASIAEARRLSGEAPAAAQGAGKTAEKGAGKAGASDSGTVDGVAGTVTLSAELKAKAAPTDTVFIFARPAQGPRMPLAVMRVQVKDLPAKFSLNDAMAMSPNFKLSGFSEVVVGARVSKSGQATPQSGDLEGLSGTVKLGARDVAIVIDRVVSQP